VALKHTNIQERIRTMKDTDLPDDVIKTPDGMSDKVRGVNAADELEQSERLQRLAQEENAEEQDDDTAQDDE
jgi:hypothetical protein